jgi:hypothetical protein
VVELFDIELLLDVELELQQHLQLQLRQLRLTAVRRTAASVRRRKEEDP